MTALAIDTSTETLSLCCRGDGFFFDLSRNIDLRHCEELVPLADWLFSRVNISPKDLDLVVVSGGPGSFTGLRIGMASAKGLAAGAGCPLVSVPTLDIYGQFPCEDCVTLPLIDARKKRFYAAFYRGGKRLCDYMDASPEEILAKAAEYPRVMLTGPHASTFWALEIAREKPGVFVDPDAGGGKAAVLLRLGMEAFRRGERNCGLIYIREPEVTTPKFPGL
ncbi:MAG: tRNA (adenosine(37)-N6)-threonylcarbamoyltransferase complex dimerization subunit type 1 TsaB [Spirochaetales bacterium]|jgi:tRNA threonylcarbamoyladenosine biosynthesis protein TsaB|nr:tRNA (adenosine(37)-N6)-threonylcarbamoyltransferase complex dimerization subunit type 1 TsaB [Spirochaetales bacterium]